MKKILVPTDFSEESYHAINFAKEFAQKIGAQIDLLHVMEVPYSSYSIVADVKAGIDMETIFQSQLIRVSMKKLENIASSIADNGIACTHQLVPGNPFTKIHEYILEKKCDWIFMGSKGASGIKEVLVGSNTERIIRHAPCPVMTVKGETDLSKINHILFPTDNSPEQLKVVKAVKELQELLDAQIHLLRLVTPRNFLTEGRAKEQLEEFATTYGFKNFNFHVSEADFADQGIVDFAVENQMGMIAMGTKGRTGLSHVIAGSKVEDVANHSHIPVLSLKMAK